MPTTTPTRRRLRGVMSKRLQDARVEAGLSRKALAELIGLSERAVNYYEDPSYGRARKPYIVRAWAEATERDFEELWGPPDRPLDRSGWLGQTSHHHAA